MAIQEQISKLEAGSASYAEKTTVVGQPDAGDAGKRGVYAAKPAAAQAE